MSAIGPPDARRARWPDPKLHAELPGSVYTLRSSEEVAHALEAAGFREVTCAIDDETSVTLARARR